MIKVKKLFNFLKNNKIEFFSGVPDSILKETSSILEKKNKYKHLIGANEGVAASICIGYHLSSGKVPCLYLQNSGIGNAINPLISIAHRKVYSIPLLMLIGWRGAPGQKDEPQHVVKGLITKKILESLDINYCVLNNNKDFKKLKKLIFVSKKNKKPVACLVKKNTFFSDFKKKKILKKSGVLRENFLRILLSLIKKNSRLVSTTGYTSRELNQIRGNKKYKNGRDFYMVGGMGHASSVALGLSILKKNQQVICIDGDGSLIMHLGSLANIGYYASRNYKHIILNNSSHESVGGQKTNVEKINFSKVSKGLGYKNFYKIDRNNQIQKKIKKFLKSTGPSFLEVKISEGTMKNLKRPRNLPEVKKFFMGK